MTKRFLPFLAALSVASLPSLAQAQKVGPEFQVNQSTTAFESDADVASDSTGNFMVVWQNTGYGNGVLGRAYDRDGNPLNDEFQIGESGDPAVASTNGNFIVVWGDRDHSVLGQLYDIDGNALGEQLQIPEARTSPHVAADASGNFVVVAGGIGRRFDSDGNPLGGFPLSDSGAVASDADGNFVVVWSQRFEYEIYGQRYDRNGNPLGGRFHVNTYTTDYQIHPSVAATPDGHFLVVWQSGHFVGFSQRRTDQPAPKGWVTGSDGSQYGVSGQLYDPTGTRIGGELQVNQFTMCNQGHADVATAKDGNFVVVWQDYFYHQRNCGQTKVGVFGRRYDIQGRPLTNEFQVSTETNHVMAFPAVASASSGGFVVVWETYRNPLQSGYGIFGQRFSRASWRR